jgi:hypothetical protein
VGWRRSESGQCFRAENSGVGEAGLDALALRKSIFPFTATREEDEGDAYFREGSAEAPFRLGHTMEVLGLEFEDDP